jgi:hypothetical protein
MLSDRSLVLCVLCVLVALGGVAALFHPAHNIRYRIAPASASADGFSAQRRLLRVLRRPTARDHDRQVAAQLRAMKNSGGVQGIRGRSARMLGKTASGYAYVLLASRRYRSGLGRWSRNGLCLTRRGSQGGAGQCQSTADLLAGRIHGALAKETYGLVPDGVVRVVPRAGDRPVQVHRNFYRYASRGTSRVRAPKWLDAHGHIVAKTP